MTPTLLKYLGNQAGDIAIACTCILVLIEFGEYDEDELDLSKFIQYPLSMVATLFLLWSLFQLWIDTMLIRLALKL